MMFSSLGSAVYWRAVQKAAEIQRSQAEHDMVCSFAMARQRGALPFDRRHVFTMEKRNGRWFSVVERKTNIPTVRRAA